MSDPTPEVDSERGPLQISMHELMTEEQINFFRAALGHHDMTQKEFCEKHDLRRETLSRALNRSMVPPEAYKEAMEGFLQAYAEKFRFLVEELEDGESSAVRA